MSGLHVARRFWLTSLLVLAIGLGVELPRDIVGSGTGAAAMVGALAAIASAYRVTALSQLYAYVLALAASVLAGVTLGACSYNMFGDGFHIWAALLCGAALALQCDAVWWSFRSIQRMWRERGSVIALCACTGLPAYLLLLQRFPQPSTFAYVAAGSAAVFSFSSRVFVRVFCTNRCVDSTWTMALTQTNRLFVRPIDAYREQLRNTDG